MTTNRVSPLRAWALTHRLLVRQLFTVGRGIALGVLGAVVMIVAWVDGRNGDTDDAKELLDTGVEIITALGFIVLPIVALVFAGTALGDPREDETLVYLWLRPMNRGSIVLGAITASVTISLPFTVLPVALAAVLINAGSELVTATVVAGLVGLVTYSAVFVLLGLMVKNSIVWGLAYIILWEGIVAEFGSFANRIAIRGYTGSILADRTGVDNSFGDLSQGSAMLAAAFITLAAMALASVRMNRLDVA